MVYVAGSILAVCSHITVFVCDAGVPHCGAWQALGGGEGGSNSRPQKNIIARDRRGGGGAGYDLLIVGVFFAMFSGATMAGRFFFRACCHFGVLIFGNHLSLISCGECSLDIMSVVLAYLRVA